jgi:hypothetical protein
MLGCWFSTFGDIRSMAFQRRQLVCLSLPDLNSRRSALDWRGAALESVKACVRECVSEAPEDWNRMEDAVRVSLFVCLAAHVSSVPVDSRKCQTAAASPAEPGGLLC